MFGMPPIVTSLQPPGSAAGQIPMPNNMEHRSGKIILCFDFVAINMSA